VQEFINFVQSREGQEAVVKAGFYPLPIDQVGKLSVALGSTLPPAGASSKQ
jgi:phosphate transport system substrate-binding protein